MLIRPMTCQLDGIFGASNGTHFTVRVFCTFFFGALVAKLSSRRFAFGG